MKWIKYIGHPILLICVYLLLIIEGDYFGGFYLLYILMALPAGAPFAISAIAGILIVIIGYKLPNANFHFTKPTLYLSGFLIMIFSLILFFMRKERLQTFELFIPLATFICFGVCSICFLIYSSSIFFKRNSLKGDQFKVVI